MPPPSLAVFSVAEGRFVALSAGQVRGADRIFHRDCECRACSCKRLLHGDPFLEKLEQMAHLPRR